jgi:hypothetical protein
MDYSGWDDGMDKFLRIAWGKFGQCWVAKYCYFNDIPCEIDRSHPHITDVADVKINGRNVDVKISFAEEDVFIGQVSPGAIKNKFTKYYIFLSTNRPAEWIEPIGIISADKYKQESKFVKWGEKIPGTNIQQRFRDGSYFLPELEKHCVPFTVENLKNTIK